MKVAYTITSYLFLLLGVSHIAMTRTFFPGFGLDALWFVGTGLALVILALLNLTGLKTSTKQIHTLVIIANTLGTILLILIAIKLSEIQAFVGVTLVVALLICSVLNSFQLPSK